MVLVIANVIFVIAAVILVVSLIQTASKFDWAFGDDSKREGLSYVFMRLLVGLVFLALLAAIVNVISLGLI